MRRFNGQWQILAIRPRGKSHVWALPKGHIDGRESEQEAAVREVREETGVRVSLDEKLGDIEYWFRADGERIHKSVAFFLLQWASGAPMPQATEVEEAAWIDMESAHDKLNYAGERELVLKAAEILARRIAERT